MNCVTAIILSVLMLSAFGEEPSKTSSCPVFVLKFEAGDFNVETERLARGETREYQSNPDTGILDVICPVGPGGSGSLVRLKDRNAIIVRCADAGLQVTTHAANGKEWGRPVRSIEDLTRYDVRLSVTAADGAGRAFLIEQYNRVSAETVGPVLDMFAGRVPMTEGDFTVFTYTYHHGPDAAVYGQAELDFDRWPIVHAVLPGGQQGDFIVDTGAGTTVVSKRFVPDDVTIEKTSMVQYSSAGRKLLKYAPGGATGTVETIVGQAALPELRIGEIVFRDVTVDVLKEMPDFFGRPIAGILGLDLLRRCELLSLALMSDGEGEALLHLASAALGETPDAVEVPFAFVKSHLMVQAGVNGIPVHFILDTGAPGSFLDARAAKAIGLDAADATRRSGRGLDGGTADIFSGARAGLTLGSRKIDDVRFAISALPAFSSMRVHGQKIGLLGNDVLGRFRRVEIDFVRRKIRFIE